MFFATSADARGALIPNQRVRIVAHQFFFVDA